MTVEDLIPPEGITGLVALVLAGAFWFSGTVGVLCLMEVGRDSRLIWRLISANRELRPGFVCLPACTPTALGGGEQQALHRRGICESSVVHTRVREATDISTAIRAAKFRTFERGAAVNDSCSFCYIHTQLPHNPCHLFVDTVSDQSDDHYFGHIWVTTTGRTAQSPHAAAPRSN